MHAVRSPVTFTAVRNIPSKRSTPIIMIIPSEGIPALLSTEAKITTPPPGMAGVPIDAATIVTTTTMMLRILNSRPYACAIKSVVMVW